ncbi:MAG: hypothetical protein VB080_04235 [Propionicimonas sp.]|nr:hypothetical protein [Propionicimonas sp.]MEA4943629.1 hypothetical protein [Propionicimonas sp.]MEA5052577.1 hypothetical protein [Propionicimonas sp.]MEA5117615.1 hypothetical protein [Propionicimonas sp.]
MQIPPIDVTRWTLRALKLLDQTWRTIVPQPSKQSPPSPPDRRRPDIW